MKQTIFTCNRCELQGYTNDAKAPSGWAMLQLKLRGGKRGYLKALDLCPNCVRDFQEWSNAGAETQCGDNGQEPAAAGEEQGGDL